MLNASRKDQEREADMKLDRMVEILEESQELNGTRCIGCGQIHRDQPCIPPNHPVYCDTCESETATLQN